MAADVIQKQIIIDIKVDTEKYIKELAAAKTETVRLKTEQAVFKLKLGETSKEYINASAKVAENAKNIKDLTRTINNATMVNDKYTGSLEQEKAVLSVLTYQLNKMGEVERDTTEEGAKLQKNILETTEALKANEKAVGNTYRNVGNYEASVQGLKQELKAAKSEMIAVAAAMGMDSKEFQIAANKAGAVKDKIDDINTAAKATATGSDLGKFRNQLKDVGASLMDLDFKEAAERAKGLKTIAEGMTFKSMIAGTKSAVVALYEMAAAFLATPFGMVTVAIGAIVGGLYALSKMSSETAKKQIDNIESVVKGYETLYDVQIKLLSALGRDTDIAEKMKLEMQRQGIDKQIQVLDILSKYNNGLNEEQLKQYKELKQAQLINIADVAVKEIEIIKKRTEASEKAIKKSEDSIKKSKDIIKGIEDKNLAEDLKRDEERLSANKQLLSKIQDAKIESLADGQDKDMASEALSHLRELQSITESKANNDTKHAAIEAQQVLHEKAIQDIKDKYIVSGEDTEKKRVQESGKEWLKEIADKEKLEADKAKVEQDAADASIELTKKRAAEIKKIEDAGVSAMKEGITAVFTIKNNQREQEITGIETEMNAKINALQAQADAGIISQAEFETKSNRIKLDAATKEKDIKLKTWEANKRAAEINVGIKTAEAIITAYTGDPYSANALAIIAALVGATQLAVIESQKPPAFAKSGLTGKRIGINDGQSINRSNGDNLLATVRTGEVILNEGHQQALGGDATFRAIGVPGFANSGRVSDGGAMATRLSSDIDSQVRAINTQRRLNRTMKAPVVLVESIMNAVETNVKVTSRGDI